MRGNDRHEHVAIDLRTGLIHSEHAIRVAVVRDAEIDLMRTDQLGDDIEVRRPAFLVDVHAVVVAVDRVNRRSKVLERLHGRLGRRPVAAVDRDREARKVAANALDRVRDVPLRSVGHERGTAHIDARRTVPVPLGNRILLDLVLDLIGQLEAVPVEELDAVVLQPDCATPR